MAKTKEQKREFLNSLKDKLEKAKSIIFVGFNGLTVNEVEEIRKKCRENNLEYLVAKKTLLKKALKDMGIEPQAEMLSNEIAVVLSYEDEVMGAKIIGEFAKNNEALILKGGVLESKVIDLNMVKTLISIPSKQELYAKLVGTVKAPVNGFVNVLSGNLRGLVQVLNSIKDKK